MLLCLCASDSFSMKRSMSPAELLASDQAALFDNTTIFRVQFEVGAVRPTPTHYPDGSRHNVLHLVPTGDTGEDFTVEISRMVEATLLRIGVEDIEKHFTGQSIMVEGIMGQTGLDLIGSETIWTYHITLRSLDQLLSLRPTAAKRGPAERTVKNDLRTFGSLDEFFNWADPLLKAGKLDELQSAQSDTMFGSESKLVALRLLREQLGDRTLAEIFAGREFDRSYAHFKLGGHDKELGHCHIDFVLKDHQWSLKRVWFCR